MLQRADLCTQESDEPEPSQSSSPGQPQTPQWCKCGRCRHMDNPVESVCCNMWMCVTTMETFHDVVLNRNVLSVCIIDRGDYMGEDPTYTPASYRKAAYWQYILYSHGYLGRVYGSILHQFLKHTWVCSSDVLSFSEISKSSEPRDSCCSSWVSKFRDAIFHETHGRKLRVSYAICYVLRILFVYTFHRLPSVALSF